MIAAGEMRRNSDREIETEMFVPPRVITQALLTTAEEVRTYILNERSS